MKAPSVLVCIALASIALPTAAQFSYPARVQQTGSCPPDEQRERTRSNINSDLDRLLRDVVVPPLMPCGGLEWRRFAYVNTTENDLCPRWDRVDSNSIILCRANVGFGAFDSIKFNTIPYVQVCGMVTAYQFGSPECF